MNFRPEVSKGALLPQYDVAKTINSAVRNTIFLLKEDLSKSLIVKCLPQYYVKFYIII
jgi:hypothetical protein